MKDNERANAPAPALRATTGYLLSWVARDASARFETALAGVGISPAQYGVLTLLHDQPHKQARLSEALAVFPPQMVGHVNELSARGWVERRPHPTDGRAVEVHLLPTGAAVLEAADAAVRSATDDIFGALDPAERAQLHRLLVKLAHREPDAVIDPTPSGPAAPSRKDPA